MLTTIEAVSDARATHALEVLVEEYERSLPADLRHGSRDREFDGAFLARFDGRYGGCVAITVSGDLAILKRLYVRPEYRGHGAARALTLAAIDFARQKQCERVVLDTEAQRLNAAYELYRSLGFKECEPYGPVDYANPTYMELRLR